MEESKINYEEVVEELQKEFGNLFNISATKDDTLRVEYLGSRSTFQFKTLEKCYKYNYQEILDFTIHHIKDRYNIPTSSSLKKFEIFRKDILEKYNIMLDENNIDIAWKLYTEGKEKNIK